MTEFEITGVTSDQPGGTVRTKNVTLTAPVKLPDGQTVRKTLVVTMERRAAGWTITGVAAFQR